MLSSATNVQELLEIAPEWEAILIKLKAEGCEETHEALKRIGPQSIYKKALSLTEQQARFTALVRELYLQPVLAGMLKGNQSLRRFHSQRRLDARQQNAQALSLSSDLSQKLEGALKQHLNRASEDGFKVLLPAYLQRSVHNGVVDYIREEWNWERSTLQDLNLDTEQEDPRQNIAETADNSPDNLVLSKEKVGQLNELRQHLEAMLKDPSLPKEAMTVIDCLFGLGLTEASVSGQEMTMRECCERLNIPGETQARRIARCQVYLDKGLDLVRQRIRNELPGLVEAWQSELNVNSASRRELSRQLDLTETEVERLVQNRQYSEMEELVERGVIKSNRLPKIVENGAVAAYVPVDINSATARDMTDILGLPREICQKIVAERPFANLAEMTGKGLLTTQMLSAARQRGAVLRVRPSHGRMDLNSAGEEELVAAGLPEDVIHRILRGRPFLTWSELEEFLGLDCPVWNVLRQKYCLGLTAA